MCTEMKRSIQNPPPKNSSEEQSPRMRMPSIGFLALKEFSIRELDRKKMITDSLLTQQNMRTTNDPIQKRPAQSVTGYILANVEGKKKKISF